MGRTEVTASIIGDRGTREYIFLIDTGAAYMGLPREDIDSLGLEETGATMRFLTATGPAELPTYFARGSIDNQRFGAILVPASRPLIGYELLENLRYRVNPVTQSLERVSDDEIGPPYLL